MITPPTIPGIYRCDTRFGGVWYRRWNGINWMAGDTTIEGATRSIGECRSPNCMNEQWAPV